MEETEGTGPGRRDVIKKGAVAAGVIWAVPVVQSLTNPAGAQVPPGTPTPGGDCEAGQIRTVCVKYNVGGTWEAATNDNFGTCIHCGCAPENQYAAGLMAADAVVTQTGQQVCIQLPEGVILEAAAAKEGLPCDTTPDAGSDPETGRVCFTKDIAGGVSNISLKISLCIPTEYLCD